MSTKSVLPQRKEYQFLLMELSLRPRLETSDATQETSWFMASSALRIGKISAWQGQIHSLLLSIF